MLRFLPVPSSLLPVSLPGYSLPLMAMCLTHMFLHPYTYSKYRVQACACLFLTQAQQQ